MGPVFIQKVLPIMKEGFLEESQSTPTSLLLSHSESKAHKKWTGCKRMCESMRGAMWVEVGRIGSRECVCVCNYVCVCVCVLTVE